MEQEKHYIQILVEKIVALRPDLVLVGQAVSRQAQEYLEQHEVVVIQHVKPKLMQRIARYIGATILSSTDHVMNQHGWVGVRMCVRVCVSVYVEMRVAVA